MKRLSDGSKLWLAGLMTAGLVALHALAVYGLIDVLSQAIYVGPVALNARFGVMFGLALLFSVARRYKPFDGLFSQALWRFRDKRAARRLKRMGRAVETLRKYYFAFCMIALIIAFWALVIYGLSLNA